MSEMSKVLMGLNDRLLVGGDEDEVKREDYRGQEEILWGVLGFESEGKVWAHVPGHDGPRHGAAQMKKT